MKVKFKSTTFENLNPADEFKLKPYAGDEVPKYVKVEPSVVADKACGVYNSIKVTGQISYENFLPNNHVYKIQEFSQEEEV